jgi:TolA-binding protein
VSKFQDPNVANESASFPQSNDLIVKVIGNHRVRASPRSMIAFQTQQVEVGQMQSKLVEMSGIMQQMQDQIKKQMVQMQTQN